MPKDPVLIIDKPNFVVKLHEDVIEVDRKSGARKVFEDVIESLPVLTDAHRVLACPAFPSDVKLRDIDAVEVDDQGSVKLVIPWSRDTIIPLEPEEARQLENALNDLIPLAKTRIEQHEAPFSANEEPS
jgi:hypothetical protein